MYTVRKGGGEEGKLRVDPLCNPKNSLKLEHVLKIAKSTKLTLFASSEEEFGKSNFRQFNHLFFSLKSKDLLFISTSAFVLEIFLQEFLKT